MKSVCQMVTGMDISPELDALTLHVSPEKPHGADVAQPAEQLIRNQ